MIDNLKNQKNLNMLQVLKKASGDNWKDINVAKKSERKEYTISDGGDFILYFSCNDVNKLKYDNIILSKNIFGLDLRITFEEDYASISTYDCKYTVQSDWCKILAYEDKNEIIEEIQCDNNILQKEEFISSINMCNYNALFDSKDVYEAYLLFCLAIFLYAVGINNILIYDTHEGIYLQKKEIFNAILNFMNNNLNYFE